MGFWEVFLNKINCCNVRYFPDLFKGNENFVEGTVKNVSVARLMVVGGSCKMVEEQRQAGFVLRGFWWGADGVSCGHMAMG